MKCLTNAFVEDIALTRLPCTHAHLMVRMGSTLSESRLISLAVISLSLIIRHFRIIESTTRTMNNLLERLHASFFFYILTSAQSFVKIGGYLPAAVIMSIAMTLGGLALWVQAGWLQTRVVVVEPEQDIKEAEKSEQDAQSSVRWVQRSRPVLDALLLMGYTHILGTVILFALGTKTAVELFTVS